MPCGRPQAVGLSRSPVLTSKVGPSLAALPPHISAQAQLPPELAEGTVLCVKRPAEVVTRGTWETGLGKECVPPTLPPPLKPVGFERKVGVEKEGRGEETVTEESLPPVLSPPYVSPLGNAASLPGHTQRVLLPSGPLSLQPATFC